MEEPKGTKRRLVMKYDDDKLGTRETETIRQKNKLVLWKKN